MLRIRRDRDVERDRERNTDSNKGLRSEPAGSGSLKEVRKEGGRTTYAENTINRQGDLATFFMLFAFGNNFESSTRKEKKKKKDNTVISLFHVSQN